MKFLFLFGHAHLALDPSAQRASGGAELQVALLSRELVARGHETLSSPRTPVRTMVSFGKECGSARADASTPDARAETLRALPRLVRVLRAERPDYVVVYGWTAWLYVLCQLRTLVPFRLAFVCALDAEIDGGFRRTNPFRGFLFERGMRLSDARFAITEHQARLFRKRGMPCTVTRLLLPQTKARRARRKVRRPPLGRALPSREATASLPRSRGTLAGGSLPDDLLRAGRGALEIRQQPGSRHGETSSFSRPCLTGKFNAISTSQAFS